MTTPIFCLWELLSTGAKPMVGMSEFKERDLVAIIISSSIIGIAATTTKYAAPARSTSRQLAMTPWSDVYTDRMIAVMTITNEATVNADNTVRIVFRGRYICCCCACGELLLLLLPGGGGGGDNSSSTQILLAKSRFIRYSRSTPACIKICTATARRTLTRWYAQVMRSMHASTRSPEKRKRMSSIMAGNRSRLLSSSSPSSSSSLSCRWRR